MKKLLSMLLALAMVISMVPSVFAEEAATDVEAGATVTPAIGGETSTGLWYDEAVTESGEKFVTLEEGGSYVYYYVATGDGFVDAVATTEVEGINVSAKIMNITNAEAEDGAFAEGDEVMIVVNADAAALVAVAIELHIHVYSDATCEAPATCECGATIGEKLEHDYQDGLCVNCGDSLRVALQDTANKLSVEAGATAYFEGYFGGMVASFAAPAGTTIAHNGTTYTSDGENVITFSVVAPPRYPALFTVVNAAEEAVFVTLTFDYPEGTMENPEEVALAPNLWGAIGAQLMAEVAEGGQGHYFKIVAEADGQMVISMSYASDADGNDIGWTYVVNNVTAGTYGDTHWSDDEEPVYDEILNVTAGDEIIVMLNTYDPDDMWNAPAGTVYASVAFNAVGSSNNPEVVELAPNMFGAIGAQLMAEVAEGGQGHYFKIVADADGQLVISMSYASDADYNDLGWTYVVNNVTAGTYGDTHSFDDEEPVYDEILNVTAGDEIIVMLNTYDPDDMWNAPAGTVYASVAFNAVGSSNNPEEVVLTPNTPRPGTIGAMLMAEVAEGGQGHYFKIVADADGQLVISMSYASDADGNDIGWTYVVNNVTAGTYGDTHSSDDEEPVYDEIINVTAGDEIIVMLNTYDPDDMWNAPAGTVYAGVAFNAVGSKNNPVEIAETGAYTAEIAEGATDGYYYTYTAAEDGIVVVTINTADGWQYVVNNITANAYGDAQWSDSDPVLTTYEVEVSAGDVVEIMVMTYDPENPWAPPAGSVEWTLSTKEAVPPLVITQQPVDSNSIIGGKAEFSVVAEGEGLTYQWYVNKNDGAGFVKATYTGNKTAALSIPVYESRIGWTVYCVITDAEGNTLTTDTVTLTLKPADIDLTYQTSGTQYVVVDKVATFVVTATSSIGEITYQWQISSDGGATWSGTTWNGYNTRRLYVNAYDSRDGWMVRCIMTDAEGARLISEPATLAIKENPLYVVTQAENAEVVLDTTVYFNFEVGGNVGDVSYTWFISGDDGVTWAKTGLTGFNTTQLRVNAYNSRNGKMFKCIAIDSEGNKLESAAVKLTLKANPITIVKKPTSATVSAGETAYFTFQVENFVGEVSYQWYYRKSADGSWSATGMTGAKTDTLEVAATAARNGYQYYCMATDTAGNKMKSNAVTLTVE